MSQPSQTTALQAGAICACPALDTHAVVLVDPVPGRRWLTVMPLGQPPEFYAHPLRPHLRLQDVELLIPPGQDRPSCLTTAPLLLGDLITTVEASALEAPQAVVSAAELLRLRQLGALAIGLRPSDLRQAPALASSGPHSAP